MGRMPKRYRPKVRGNAAIEINMEEQEILKSKLKTSPCRNKAASPNLIIVEILVIRVVLDD